MAISRALFTSDSDEWSTPQALFDALDSEFHFDLDPCSTDNNCKCERHFTIYEDGLSKNWGGAESSVIHHIATLVNG